MRRLCAFVLVTAVAAAACSGDDDVAESTTTPPASEVTSTTADTTPTTTEVPATIAPPPTTGAITPPTTQTPPPTTMEPTPTTIDPLEDLAGSIQRDLTAGNEVLQDVLANPSSPTAEARLEAYFSGQALGFLVDLVRARVEDDLTVDRNPDVPASIELVDEPELLSGSDLPTAEVTVCQIDSGVLMAPINDTDVRIPVNEDVIRVIARVTVELVDGVWLMRNGGTGEEEIGVTTCE